MNNEITSPFLMEITSFNCGVLHRLSNQRVHIRTHCTYIAISENPVNLTFFFFKKLVFIKTISVEIQGKEKRYNRNDVIII